MGVVRANTETALQREENLEINPSPNPSGHRGIANLNLLSKVYVPQWTAKEYWCDIGLIVY